MAFDPISLGISGLLGIGGGLASFFGGRQKRPSYDIPQPEMVRLTDRPVGKALFTRMLENLQNAPPNLQNTLIPAIAAQSRAALRETTIPGIEAAASGRGLGRSTIVPRDIGKATAQTERDIVEQQARFNLADFMQQQEEIARRENLALNYAMADANLATQAAGLGQKGAMFQALGQERAGAADVANILGAIGTGLRPFQTQSNLAEILRLAEQARRASPFTGKIQVGGGGGGF